MRLALAVGRVDVDSMLEEITSVQLSEWMAFDRIEPFEDKRADVRNAVLCCTLANIWRDEKKSKPFSPEDFMLRFDKEYLEMDERLSVPDPDRIAKQTSNVIQSSSTKKGQVRMYEGEAPAIRRIGKRGGKSRIRDKMDRIFSNG